VCEVFDVVFPPKGTLITPRWPAATNARSFVLLRCLGLLAGVVAQAVEGRMPADQETIRYTGFYGRDLDGTPFLSREVLGGGSAGRYYADGNDAIHIVPDSRNQPAEFTETRFPNPDFSAIIDTTPVEGHSCGQSSSLQVRSPFLRCLDALDGWVRHGARITVRISMTAASILHLSNASHPFQGSAEHARRTAFHGRNDRRLLTSKARK
jgi:hypothetical protein